MIMRKYRIETKTCSGKVVTGSQCASNAYKAWELWKAANPLPKDQFYCDIRMYRMDGTQVMAKEIAKRAS